MKTNLTKLQKFACWVGIFAGIFFILRGVSLPSQALEIFLPKPALPSHTPLLDKNQDTNLSPLPKEISSPFPSQPAPQKAEASPSLSPEKDKKIEKLIENLQAAKVSFDKKLCEQMEHINQDILYQLYEEDLPDNIIDEKKDEKFMHPCPKALKDLQILPDKKPAYFGPIPLIAIVIDDMGISPKRTAEIIDIKAPLTASFLTYGRNLETQIQKAKNSGHEIMLHVPMEAQTTKDVAPDVLTTRMSQQEISERLQKMLQKFPNINGINNHMGSKMTENEQKMAAVMEVLKQHRLFFLDSKTSAKSKAQEAALQYGVAYAQRHVFLDNLNDKNYILKQLQQMKSLAQKNGYAIAIGHPKTQTVLALKEWLPKNQDIQLVPLSHIVKILHPNFVQDNSLN